MAKLSSEFLPKFERLIQNPEDYLNVQNKVAIELTELVKNLYDFTKSVEGEQASVDALPELIVEDFDQEQIWQELELQNSGRSENFVADVAGLVARRKRLVFPIDSKNNEVLQKNERDCSQVNDSGKIDSLEAEDSNNDGQSEGDEALFSDGIRPKSRTRKGPTRVSEVDDKFFKLCELEEFLDKEDKREAGEDDSSDESIDLFRSSDDEDDQSENDLHYADFFDEPGGEGKVKKKKIEKDESEEEAEGDDGSEKDDDEEDYYDEDDGKEDDDDEEEEEKKEEKVNKQTKKVHFMSSDEDSEDDKKTPKSSLETRQERLQARIKQLEEQALSEKPWQMKGEISASARPQNSLLEEMVEFDLTTRPAPVMTEKTTLQLEDIILQRVKDRAWDDVERKVKPVETPNEYKKKLVLDQEKSKLSLAQIYEQEYIKQREALNADESENRTEEEPAEHQEVRKMMTSLFTKLDALSNFHYTPRPAAPEVKIVSNLPAITMEEVTPVAVSDAALLAPEEVKEKPKGDLIGKAERTSTDKKRERRQKKARQRERRVEREKRQRAVEKVRPGLGNKYSKERAMRDLENMTKNSNVTRMDEKANDKAVKSSAAFFNQLQDEVKTLIKKKTATKNSALQQNGPSAKKLKL